MKMINNSFNQLSFTKNGEMSFKAVFFIDLLNKSLLCQRAHICLSKNIGYFV